MTLSMDAAERDEEEEEARQKAYFQSLPLGDDDVFLPDIFFADVATAGGKLLAIGVACYIIYSVIYHDSTPIIGNIEVVTH